VARGTRRSLTADEKARLDAEVEEAIRTEGSPYGAPAGVVKDWIRWDAVVYPQELEHLWGEDMSLDHLSPLLEEAYLYKGYGGRVGAKVDALMRSSLERLERQGRLLSLEGWSLRPDHSARNWMHVDDLDPEERKWRGL
jgi:hypothetical protein